MRNQIDSAAGYGVRLGTINSANEKAEDKKVAEQLLADHLELFFRHTLGLDPKKAGRRLFSRPPK
jgi:superfamily II DNA helicase RecQ